jgi:hypothetical protein
LGHTHEHAAHHARQADRNADAKEPLDHDRFFPNQNFEPDAGRADVRLVKITSPFISVRAGPSSTSSISDCDDGYSFYG